MSSKKPFDAMLQRVSATIDKNYSNQKSTFKGWASFFKAFSGITKDYSNELQKLSKDGGDHMGLKLPLPDCIKVETPTIKAIMSEMLYTVSSLSNLHHNLSERLLEMAETYSQLYDGVKKTKDHFMEALQVNFPKELNRTTPKEQIERRITKSFYEMIDRLEEDEMERAQKIRENSIIFYTVYKKIAEKQEEVVSSNATRLSKMEIEFTNKQLTKLVNETIDMHNAYPGQPKIQKKAERQVQSLRESLNMSKRASKEAKVENSRGSLKDLEKQSEEQQHRLIVETNPKYELRRGLLNKGMSQYHELASFVKPQHVNSAVFAMLQSYYFAEMHQTDTKNNLTGIRVRLRLPEYKFVANKTRNFKEFLEMEFDYRPNADKLALIESMLLSMQYREWSDESELLTKIKAIAKKGSLSSSDLPTVDFTFDIWVGAAFVDILLESLFRFKEGQDFLVDNYAELFRLICKFGREYLLVEPQLTLLMFLERVYRASNYRDQHEIELNIRQLERLIEPEDCQGVQLSDLSFYYRASLRNTLYGKFLSVYRPHTHTSLSVQFLHWIDLYLGSNDSVECILGCVRLAGFKYLCEKDPDRMLFGVLWENRERVKTLSEVIQKNEFVLIDEKILQPLAENISRIYNIGLDGVKKKVRERFFSLILQTILLNLDSIDMRGLEDKEGHLLRIGIQLCKIDQLSGQPLTLYEQNFFRLLPAALASMEGEYKDLLDQARKTEMWIIEENMFATQNCYDFCSLLAKPIEFMVTILRQTQLSGTEASDFRDKFAMTIKLKLNEILKSEVVKYFSFLEASLKRLECNQPRVMIDCKRVESLPTSKEEDLRNNYASFKEACKRLNNMLFVKQQIGEITKDLLDIETQARVRDVFDTSTLQSEISRAGSSWNGELLQILRKVTKEILLIQQRVLYNLAKALVFVYLRRFFDRLYWRAEKGALDDLFSHSQVKLSEHTFMRYKEEIQDYLQLVRRCVPAEYLQKFYETIYYNLYTATKCEILNNTKFRIPLAKETIFDFLNTDIANIATVIKKLSSCSQEVVNKYFVGPIRRILDQLREEPNSLCAKFEEAFINKRQQEAQEVLAALNLRCQEGDKKTKEFVKKYKGSLQR